VLSSVPQKRRELGINGTRATGSERSLSLFNIRTLKAEPQERQEHETRLRTGNAKVKPGEVEKA